VSAAIRGDQTAGVTRRTLVAILAAVMLAAGIDAAAATQEATPAVGGEYRVATPSGFVRIPKADWKAVPSAHALGESFEQRRPSTHQGLPRLVTVFKTHMTEDVRIGRSISPTEYLEMEVDASGRLIVQIRVDKGRYWLLSRETLLTPGGPFVDTAVVRALTVEESAAAREMFASEIEQTRFLLHSQF
jgi:hypothetical protein